MFNRRKTEIITVEDYLYDTVINFLGERRIKFSMSKEYESKKGYPWNENVRAMKERKFMMVINHNNLMELYDLMETLYEHCLQAGEFKRDRG